MSDLDLHFEGVTPAIIASACQEAMDRCDAAIADIVGIPAGRRTFANTLLALEDAVDHVEQASGNYAFLAYVSADDALREAAHAWDEKLDKYSVSLAFREDLYRAVCEFAETNEAASLSGEDRRLLDFTLRDYRRNGFELPPDQRQRVRELFDRLVELGIRFRKNIDEWDDGIVVTEEDLAGLPPSFIGGLERVERGGETRFRVSLDYPEFFPFMSNCGSEQLRRELFIKDQCKGGRENVAILEEAIRVRSEVAALLGYDSWAAYVTEVRMAKDRRRVEAFLTDLREKVAVKAERDMALLREARREFDGSDTVNIWDWRFCHNRLLKTRYAIDEFAVAEYFALDACLEGLFDVTQTLFGIRYEPRPEAPTWHPEVKAFDIVEAGSGEPFARFYMDLFPRPNKYGHAAAFTLRRGRERRDGTYQRPVSAIVANFTKPTSENPSLLRHSEVVTLFHEFGHVLHQTLTRVRRLRFSGTATERDFVEAPSQMLEHWVWEKEVLQRFARHYRTGAPIPGELVDAMIAAKNVSSGVMTLRQIFFATLDLTYHSPGFDGDTTKTLEALHAITGFPYTPGTHFQSGFGHLFGYDAGYYGYLWSHVFGDDMYTRFEERSPLDPGLGAEYRRAVLERGGSVDGDELVRSFLGREPNNRAFLRNLGLDPDAAEADGTPRAG